MKDSSIGHNFPFDAAKALANVAVRRYGPKHLERGGPVARAFNEVGRGRSIDQAAAIASRQGKGHAAEIRLAAEHSIDAGLAGKGLSSRPNPRANDPHVDIEVRRGRRRVNDAQVGVGKPDYLRRKVMRSEARQVVVNVEARATFKARGDAAFDLSGDKLLHENTASGTLTAARAETDSQEILEGVLVGSPSVPEWVKLRAAATAGVSSAAVAAARSLLFGVVHRLDAGLPIDKSLVDEAFFVARNAFATSSVHSYVMVSRFLEVAGHAFDGRLLRALGGAAVVAGAISEVVVAAAQNLVACLRNEITFEEACRRVGVAAFSAVGGMAALAVATRLTAGMHPLARILLCAAAAFGGGYLGREVGTWLLPEAEAARRGAPSAGFAR